MPIEINFEKEKKDHDDFYNEFERLRKIIKNFLAENSGKGITKAFTREEIVSLAKIKSKLENPDNDAIDRVFTYFDNSLDNWREPVKYRVSPIKGRKVHYYYYDR